MKKIYFLISLIFFAVTMQAQILNPVSWTVTSKKIKDKTYEVHLTASLNKGWHIYSQSTPEGGPIPTSVNFTKNPLFDLDGKIKESGKMEKRHEEIFGVDVMQFSDKVEYVQILKLKAPVKTSANISVEYMVCNDKQCLPPVTKKFSVAL
ncbi:MAG: protein-disulfide reductase DsbD domain-containing protein [Ginsengibacter sp.]